MSDSSDGRSGDSERESGETEPDSPGIAGFLSRIFGRDSAEDGSEESADARAEAASGDFLVNLRNMRRMRVEDVAIPRADIVAVAADAMLEDVVAVFQSSTVSRLPVYAETLDQPLGLVHLKDLALKHGFGAPADGFDLRGLLRPLLFAPPSMPIGVLLQKMQAARIHMALVIDEYGGVDGLVTIEDLLEQIVGDIEDEHDEAADLLWSMEAPGVYVAQARMDLEDFEKETGVHLDPDDLGEEIDTIGGLVAVLAGRVPERGEVVMHPGGHEFEVVDADPRRVKRLRIRLAEPLSDGRREAAE